MNRNLFKGSPARNARNERCAMRIARCSSLAPRWRGRRSTPAFRAGSEYWQQKVIFSSWLSLCVRWSKICVFRVPVWTPGRSRIGRVDGRAGARREACCTLRLRNTITHEKRSKLKIVLLLVFVRRGAAGLAHRLGNRDHSRGMSEPTELVLHSGDEFRFDVSPSEMVSLTLTSGAAEVFGAEMVANRVYAFSGTQQAVFSWCGCTLQMLGTTVHAYVASESPMASYLQVHGELDTRRHNAQANGLDGPRVLVCGPTDAGKSTLSRLLANYLARSGHTGTLVDFDLEAGELLVPGALCAVPIAKPLDIERGIDELRPLAYWLGHATAAEHLVHAKSLLTSLAQSVRRRHEADPSARSGGLIIDTSGWVDGAGYELLIQQASEMRADVLIVIGDDRLHSRLMSFAESSPLNPSVLKIPKSGGVITRSTQSRQIAQTARMRNYLYGVHRELYPHSITLDFSAVAVYSIDVAPQAPSSALPIGIKLPDNQLASQQLPPRLYPALAYSILAVLHTKSGKCDDLLRANVAGFVWASAVDVERQKLTLLAPSPLAMPSLTLLVGSIKWQPDASPKLVNKDVPVSTPSQR